MTNATTPPLVVRLVHHALRGSSSPSPAARSFRFTPAVMIYAFIWVVIVFLPYPSHAQWRPYINNKQADCYGTNGSGALGYSCSSSDPYSCDSFITFRSQTNYQTTSAIRQLLQADVDAAEIARLNNAHDVNSAFPMEDLVIVPVRCSCSRIGDPWYYQHSTRYIIKYTGETYFLLANDTFQGLTTCQALMAQNPSIDSRNVTAGVAVTVPLRCACPQGDLQRATGVQYLLTYLLTWGDSIDSIAERFNVPVQSVLEANNLTPDGNIYPFTNVLVPLFAEPLSRPRVRTLVRFYAAPVDVARTKGS